MPSPDQRAPYPAGARPTPLAGAAVGSGPSWLCGVRGAPAGASSTAPSPHGAPQNQRRGPGDPTCRRGGAGPAPPAWPVRSAPTASGLRLGSAARTPLRGLFFSHGPRCPRFLLLLGGAPQGVRGRPVRPSPVALAAVAPRGALDREARGLIQVHGQRFLGPVGALQPAPLWTALDPVLEPRRDRGGKAARWSWGPLDGAAREAGVLLLLAPPPHRRTMPPAILGDSVALAAPTRHQDRLAALTEPSVAGRLEGICHWFVCHCRQPNLPHLGPPPLVRHLTRGDRQKEAESSDACISPDGSERGSAQVSVHYRASREETACAQD